MKLILSIIKDIHVCIYSSECTFRLLACMLSDTWKVKVIIVSAE